MAYQYKCGAHYASEGEQSENSKSIEYLMEISHALYNYLQHAYSLEGKKGRGSAMSYKE